MVKIQLSNGYERKDYIHNLTEEEAQFICESRGWKYVDNDWREWDMDYVDDLPSKRLTTWNGKKWVLPQGKDENGNSYWRIIADRLAAYENTGLEPDEINAMRGSQK